MVAKRPERYRDTLQAHYTHSRPIVSFMVSRLDPSDADTIWEPCAGSGELIDGVLNAAPFSQIRASEICVETAIELQRKYAANHLVDVRQEDSVDVGSESLFDEAATFTRIIANPPYGAYQSPKRRRHLQMRFPGLYVRESYGVIMYHALSLLEHDGRLVFIVPDTFLWLTRHHTLRRTLASKTTIEEIALFPSSFFPGINFGYSGLCIITLINRPPSSDHRMRILSEFASANALLECVEDSVNQWPCHIAAIRQKEMSNRTHAELVLHNGGTGITLSARANCKLGEHADIRTGFYSGNDRRWLRKVNESVPRSKHHQLVSTDQIASEPPTLHGFAGPRTFIPIIKGGAIPYSKPTHWYVDWSQAAIAEYTRKGKNPARFQNSSFYFRDGIGIPMVASGRITGALLNNRLFDQGIVGIFPHNPLLKLYLLGFFNSAIASDLVRQINPTANNSANYIKRLPLVIPTSAELQVVEPLIKLAVAEAESGSVSINVQRDLDLFYSRLWCRSSELATNISTIRDESHIS